MNLGMAIAVVIIVAVLLFTSHTYMEIPVLLLTFGAAALLNKGTNFIFGEISFVSNSVAVVLQLALAIDYAIILCHRYTEEREHMEAREAVITALSKAIPEISGSSLTTISGLFAMMFMHFRIGYDMGLVLIKAILCSLLCVFTLMPGLLMLFSPLIDRTHHKSFVPDITVIGNMVVKTRYLVAPVFAVAVVAAAHLANQCSYVYGYSTLTTAKQNEAQLEEKAINDTFGSTNLMALLVPEGDYKAEKRLLNALDSLEEVDSTMGIANVEAKDGYMLADELTPRQFAELADLDIEVARFLYGAYAAREEDYGQIVGGIDQYGVPLIQIFDFLYEQKEEGYVKLDADLNADLEDLHEQLNDAKLQLQGEHYSRLLLYTNVPEESPETFAFLKQVHQIAESCYGEEVFLVGESTNDYDLSTFFVKDNVLISILSAVFVVLVLLFTFKSAGLPVLLILVIQGSVWMNFSFPVLVGNNLFFLSYLVVSSIQMGANIDYAIVITSRYTELKKEMPVKAAMVAALNQAFPTIVTSGTILAAAGVLIGQLSSDPAISSIGDCLGRGTILSIALVMVVLPSLLLLGDSIVERTAFVMKRPVVIQSHTGTIRMNGHVKGYISGMVDAQIREPLKERWMEFSRLGNRQKKRKGR
ncbi:MAG: MMPL family transporter [Lachnospiraceae bacterium]